MMGCCSLLYWDILEFSKMASSSSLIFCFLVSPLALETSPWFLWSIYRHVLSSFFHGEIKEPLAHVNHAAYDITGNPMIHQLH